MKPSDSAAQLAGPAVQPEQMQPPAACTLPLLQLPDTAKEAITALLRVGDRRSLRLACTATQQAVDLNACQLKFTRPAPLKAGLAARFPRVARLHLDNVDYAKHEDPGEEVTLPAREDWQPWSTVTSAHLVCLPPDAIAYVVSRCTSLQFLELNGVLSGAGLEDTLAHMPGALPHLASLIVRRPALGDAELRALPSFTTLTDLTVELGDCSAVGWASLASMRQLRLLVLIHSSSSFPKGVQLDLTAWTALSKLRISSRGDDELYEHLRLPGNLAELALSSLPQLPLLQQLRVLELSADCCFESGDLQRLAAACPCLEQLRVPKLYLSKACHAAPLQRLTSLCVEESCASRPGTCLAAVFPALEKLCLHGHCGNIESDGAFFEGLLSLRDLNVGRNRMLDEDFELLDAGMSLCAADFGALRKLPLLSILRINTDAVHITGLGRLSHLVQLKLVFVGIQADWSFRDLSHTCMERPPARLEHVTFEFISMEDPADDDSDYYGGFEYQQLQEEASSMIDAAIVWLSGASILHRLTWDAAALPDDTCHWGSITNLRLFGIIAACPSVKLLELCGRSSAGTSADIIELVRQRGLEVVES